MEPKKLSLEELEAIEGGWPGECFLAIPLLFASGSSLYWYAKSAARVSYCWAT